MKKQNEEYNLGILNDIFNERNRLETLTVKIQRDLSSKLLKQLSPMIKDDMEKEIQKFEKSRNISIDRKVLGELKCSLYLKQLGIGDNNHCVNYVEALFYSYSNGYFNYERKLYFDMTEEEWKNMDFDNLLEKYVFYYDNDDKFSVRNKKIGEKLIDNI